MINFNPTLFNPRYVKYAKAHGNSPERQLEIDKEKYPGGCMCGFSLWIRNKWQEFAGSNAKIQNWTLVESIAWVRCNRQAEFDAWLKPTLEEV